MDYQERFFSGISYLTSVKFCGMQAVMAPPKSSVCWKDVFMMCDYFEKEHLDRRWGFRRLDVLWLYVEIDGHMIRREHR